MRKIILIEGDYMFQGIIQKLAQKASNFIFDDYHDGLVKDYSNLAKELIKWKNSPKRVMMLKGQLYYQDEHDILYRKRTAIGDDGKLVEVNNIPNNKVIDNQYKKMVKQKVNYLFGKPFTINTDNETYKKCLAQVFDSKFHKLIKNSAKYAYNSGICYVYPFYNEKGEFDFKLFQGFEIFPIWKDSEHTKLKAAVRIYPITVLEGNNTKYVERVEIYDSDGIHRRIFEDGQFKTDIYTDEDADIPYITYNIDSNNVSFNWECIPIIPVKYNDEEVSLLQNVKILQDGINVMLSDFENVMQEDGRNTILILENYDGENLGEFRRNLSKYGAVKVRTGEGGGGVKSLEVKVNVDNYKVLVDIFRKALIENAMGYDGKDERLSGTPNQMNLLSMYNDIDLDADDLELEYQSFLQNLLWFVNSYLFNAGFGDFFDEKVSFTFNRCMLMNEADIIANCNSSSGVLSQKTILSHHPWVNDVQAELDNLQEEKDKQNEEIERMYNPFDNNSISNNSDKVNLSGEAYKDVVEDAS